MRTPATARRNWRLPAVATVAAATFALAGCGGGGSSSNGVASLAGSSNTARGGSSTTTLPKGTPTQLLDEWATCMRAHGDPHQADPTIDTNGVIHITAPSGFDSETFKNSVCQSYLSAASTALGGNAATQKPDPAKLLKFARCMRAHGVPDFPDPSGGGLSIGIKPGSDLNPHNATFKAASTTCAKQTGVPAFSGTPQKGSIEIQGNGTNSLTHPAGSGGS